MAVYFRAAVVLESLLLMAAAAVAQESATTPKAGAEATLGIIQSSKRWHAGQRADARRNGGVSMRPSVVP